MQEARLSIPALKARNTFGGSVARYFKIWVVSVKPTQGCAARLTSFCSALGYRVQPLWGEEADDYDGECEKIQLAIALTKSQVKT